MNPVIFFRSVAILCPLSFAAVVLARDPEAASAVGTVRETTIDFARDSFDNWAKRQKESPVKPTVELRLITPELKTTTPFFSEPKKNRSIKSTSKNWLVDLATPAKPRGENMYSAFGKAPAGPMTGEISGSEEAIKMTADRPFASGADVGKSEPSPAASGMEDSSLRVPTLNPLSPYMVGWISAQDRVLLLSDTERRLATAQQLHGPASEFGYDSISALPGSRPFLGQGTNANDNSTRVPPENPYLAKLSADSPAPVAEMSKIIGPHDSGTNRPHLGLNQFPSSQPWTKGLLLSELTKSESRNSGRPNTEAKYFRQLKRF